MQTRSQTKAGRAAGHRTTQQLNTSSHATSEITPSLKLPPFKSGAEVVFQEQGKTLRGWAYNSSPASVEVLAEPDEFGHVSSRVLYSAEYQEHRVTPAERIKLAAPTLSMPVFHPGDRVVFYEPSGDMTHGEVVERFWSDEPCYDNRIQVEAWGSYHWLLASSYETHRITLI